MTAPLIHPIKLPHGDLYSFIIPQIFEYSAEYGTLGALEKGIEFLRSSMTGRAKFRGQGNSNWTLLFA